MLLGLAYQLLRFIADLVLVRIRTDAQLRAQVLALRHQLRLLDESAGPPGCLLTACGSIQTPRSRGQPRVLVDQPVQSRPADHWTGNGQEWGGRPRRPQL